MVSIPKCRELLGANNSELTDTDIQKIRDYLYSIAQEVIKNNVEDYKKNIKNSINFYE